MADTLTSPFNKTFPFLTFNNVSVNITVMAVYSISIVVSSERLSVLFLGTKPYCQDLTSNIYYPSPDVTIIVNAFLQYRYTGDSFITIPRYNDVISTVPWYIIISGFHCRWEGFLVPRPKRTHECI